MSRQASNGSLPSRDEALMHDAALKISENKYDQTNRNGTYQYVPKYFKGIMHLLITAVDHANDSANYYS